MAGTVFPIILALCGWVSGLPVGKLLFAGMGAAAISLGAYFTLRQRSPSLPPGWDREIRALQKTVDRIGNRTVMRCGNEICTELRRCRGEFAYLSEQTRRELISYYLPEFRRYFSAYLAFEQDGGNPEIEQAQKRTESCVTEISREFRKICDRNAETVALHRNASEELLKKKLHIRKEIPYGTE